jgi:hypothetical protein
MWQLKTAVFLHWCIICAVLFVILNESKQYLNNLVVESLKINEKVPGSIRGPEITFTRSAAGTGSPPLEYPSVTRNTAFADLGRPC